MLKNKRVVRIDNYEHRTPRKRVQIARVQAVWLFVRAAFATVHQTTVHAVAFDASCQAAQFISVCEMGWIIMDG